MFTAINDVNGHLGVELQARQELRCDQEVLAGALLAGDVDHALVHHALVTRVHALVDFVDNAEGCLGEILECHEVEDCRYGALAARLAVGVEDGHGLVVTVCSLVLPMAEGIAVLTGIEQRSELTRH